MVTKQQQIISNNNKMKLFTIDKRRFVGYTCLNSILFSITINMQERNVRGGGKIQTLRSEKQSRQITGNHNKTELREKNK
jgi:hypothetical protein